MYKNIYFKILCVEDNDVDRYYIHKLLVENYANIYISNNGYDGYNSYIKYNPDVVITDIRMPIWSGIKMIQEIHKINSNVPIIIISAFDIDFVTEINKLNIYKYFKKPVARVDLIVALENLLNDKVQ